MRNAMRYATYRTGLRLTAVGVALIVATALIGALAPITPEPVRAPVTIQLPTI
jgi:uncharacterized integral membrane protein